MTRDKKKYLPKDRTYYSPKDSECDIELDSGKKMKIPNPAVDDIVVNNIATTEFNYTEDMWEDK